MQYKTRSGDMVDKVCHDYYRGTPDANLAAAEVLKANPDINGKSLAEWGPLLPAGLVIELPDLEANSNATGLQLWD